MGLRPFDLLLVSPELAMVALALVVVLLDLVLDRKGIVLVVGLVGLAAPLGAAAGLWVLVQDGGAEMAFHGALIVDTFALYFKLLIVGIVGLLFLSGADYIERFRPHQAEFVALVLLSATGLMLLAGAADLIAVFVSLELASLPVVALAAFLKTETRSIEAGIKFLLLSGISSAVLLYGFAFLYGATGTVRLVALDPAVPTIATTLPAAGGALPFGSFAVLVGAVLAAAGFGFKLSIVPFQMWTPDVYEGAPTPVAAFLAVASKAAAFAVVLRLFYTALGGVSADWSIMFAVLAAVTMTVGNVVAIAQSNVKRLLGYSAIAQAGYLLIGVAAIASGGGERLGVESVLFYLGGYAAMNLAAFFAVIAITNTTGDDRIEALAGMGRRSPWLALTLAFALLSLTGIPPTVGFMGKLFLFNAAVSADLAWLAVVGVLNSVVSAYYYVGIVRTMYLRDPADARRIRAPAPAWVAMGVTSAGIIVLGVWPALLLDVARTAAGDLAPLVP